VKTNSTKSGSILFILLGCMPLLFILAFHVKQYDIRHRMKEKLENQLLQTIVIPEEDVIWVEGHEIWVNDRMFDIKSKKLENGIYTFMGLYDDEETALMKNTKDQRGKDNEENKLLTQFLKCIYTVFYSVRAETRDPGCQHEYELSFYTAMPVTQFREILTPPPQG